MKIKRVSEYNEHLYESVLGLLPQLTTKRPEPSREFFKEILKSVSIDFFIAESDAEVITGILTLANYPNITGRKFWIEDVVVESSFRGQGIGEMLVKAAIDHARSLGAKEISLTSRSSRIPANKLYQKMGFVLYETNVYHYNVEPQTNVIDL